MVGVTAGASAPEELVEAVIDRLAPRNGVEEIVITEEDEYFPPPREPPRPDRRRRPDGDRPGGRIGRPSQRRTTAWSRRATSWPGSSRARSLARLGRFVGSLRARTRSRLSRPAPIARGGEVSVSVESTPTQAPPGSWTPVRGQPPTGLSDAEVIAFAIAACESLLDEQSFGPLERLIDVRRDVPPEVRDGQEADFKSAVFTVTSCLAHTVGLRPLHRDLEVLLHQGMAAYPGHRPSPELLANEMRRAAMRLSIAVPTSTRPSASSAALVTLPEPRLRRSSSATELDVEPPSSRTHGRGPVVEPPVTPVLSEAAASPPAATAPAGVQLSEPEPTRRWFLAVVVAVALVAGLLSYSVDRMLTNSADDDPVTATSPTADPAARHQDGGATRPQRADAGQDRPGDRLEGAERHDPAVRSGCTTDVADRPAPRHMEALGHAPGALSELPIDAATLGSPRHGPVSAVPPNPVSPASTFTDADGVVHQTLVSTMTRPAARRGRQASRT